MTTHTHGQVGPRRMRATIIALGVDMDGTADGKNRILTGENCLMVGGSAEAHADWVETMLRLDSELERRGQTLSEVEPEDLAEIAWRIDSPELHEIALRIEAGLAEAGRTFAESSAEELTEMAGNLSISA